VLYKVRCRPAFAALFVTLNPGESITARAGSVISMDGGLTLKTQWAGNFCLALLRQLLGGESCSVDVLTNNTEEPLQLVLGQTTIGDIERIDLSQGPICLQRGVYLAHTSGVVMKNHWGGLGSWLAREGFFKLKLKGRGRVFIGAYGGITKKMVYGDFVLTQGHLLAYSPKLRLTYQKDGQSTNLVLARKGKKGQRTSGVIIYFQSRKLQGLISYLTSLV
jgi:uncharacterized protein (TIGR00266 family)